MITFTIQWIPPSKKNSKQVFCRGNKPTVISSKAYTQRHRETEWIIPNPTSIVDYPVRIIYTFNIPRNKDWKESMRKFDMSNKIESINDLLVDIWFLEDDNYWIIKEFESVSNIVEYWEWNVEVKVIWIEDTSLPKTRTIEDIVSIK